MEPNVLYHLAKDENSMTLLFRALCALKPVRDIVVRLFTQGKFGANDVDFDGVITHVYTGGAIPDIRLQAGDLRVVVEVKVSDWTRLTGNQPTAYLESVLSG